ncbi:MAG: OHCU decarboxylase [Proteobacteria bacterium]|nr:MAG: OHCU decarboxylase [Pseudomonadota bacterium]
MTIEQLNSLPREQFVEALGGIYEHSPWVAEHAWERRPFASLGELQDVMMAAVEASSPGVRLTLLRAHPDLGARLQMSPASTGEQAGAGLDQLTASEFERLRDLNLAYRAKFGFPFILAVKGATKAEIFAALERRFGNAVDDEFREAMRQVHRIAGFRLGAP